MTVFGAMADSSSSTFVTRMASPFAGAADASLAEAAGPAARPQPARSTRVSTAANIRAPLFL